MKELLLLALAVVSAIVFVPLIQSNLFKQWRDGLLACAVVTVAIYAGAVIVALIISVVEWVRS